MSRLVMISSKCRRGAFAVLLLGCSTPSQDHALAPDVLEALNALPDAHVLASRDDGMPLYVVGALGKINATIADDTVLGDGVVRTVLPSVVAPFRLRADDLRLRRMNVDGKGAHAFRYRQEANGLEVVGGDLVVQVDAAGSVFSVNGTARGDISPSLGKNALPEFVAVEKIAADPRFVALTATEMRLVYIAIASGQIYKAWEAVVSGERQGQEVRDLVYVDVDSGRIVADYPQIMTAEYRAAYSSNGTTAVPGTLLRSEGTPPVGDVDANFIYDNFGATWEAYHQFFNRDSYDNRGGALRGSAHYYYPSPGYAAWSQSRHAMTFSDGTEDGSLLPLERATDVVAHELTHGVTQYESGLVYSGEPGAINESLSDMFGAFVESWVAGSGSGALITSVNTWQCGEAVREFGGFRSMCDPYGFDGISADYWTSDVKNLDVHYASGIGNLAFCMLSNGGVHPDRNKSTVSVDRVGIDRAIRIMYKAQADILTSTSDYAALRTATEQAVDALGYSKHVRDAVSCAWAAVGVGYPIWSCPPLPIAECGWIHTTADATMSGMPQATPIPPGAPNGTIATLMTPSDYDNAGCSLSSQQNEFVVDYANFPSALSGYPSGDAYQPGGIYFRSAPFAATQEHCDQTILSTMLYEKTTTGTGIWELRKVNNAYGQYAGGSCSVSYFLSSDDDYGDDPGTVLAPGHQYRFAVRASSAGYFLPVEIDAVQKGY